MKVKYALTLALSHRAELLLLDEPTSGLDPVSREELLDIFLRLSEQGVTILFSTHITSDLAKCADIIIYIRRGKVLAESALQSYVAQYCAAELTPVQMAGADAFRLIGCKRSKNGHTALVRAADAVGLDAKLAPADLETIMVHMEQEVEGC